MNKLVFQIKRVLGFTRTGASLLGKHARKLTPARGRTQRYVGVVLVSLATAIVLVHQFANIGGALALSTNSVPTPKLAADAQTVAAIQAPIAFTYESRGVSWFHPGADLVAPTGTPVRPIMAGVVEATPYDPFGYGSHVIVKHDAGYESIYGHLSKIEVKEGQKVGLDTELGLSGSTGFSTGPHLHLEIHQNGQVVNPKDLVPGIN